MKSFSNYLKLFKVRNQFTFQVVCFLQTKPGVNTCRVTDLTLCSAASCHTPPIPTLQRDLARALRRSHEWAGVSGTSDGTKGGHITAVCCQLSLGYTCMVWWPHGDPVPHVLDALLSTYPASWNILNSTWKSMNMNSFHPLVVPCSYRLIFASYQTPRLLIGQMPPYQIGAREKDWVRGCGASM